MGSKESFAMSYLALQKPELKTYDSGKSIGAEIRNARPK